MVRAFDGDGGIGKRSLVRSTPIAQADKYDVVGGGGRGGRPDPQSAGRLAQALGGLRPPTAVQVAVPRLLEPCATGDVIS